MSRSKSFTHFSSPRPAHIGIVPGTECDHQLRETIPVRLLHYITPSVRHRRAWLLSVGANVIGHRVTTVCATRTSLNLRSPRFCVSAEKTHSLGDEFPDIIATGMGWSVTQSDSVNLFLIDTCLSSLGLHARIIRKLEQLAYGQTALRYVRMLTES
jgi:hypothetical protein